MSECSESGNLFLLHPPRSANSQVWDVSSSLCGFGFLVGWKGPFWIVCMFYVVCDLVARTSDLRVTRVCVCVAFVCDSRVSCVCGGRPPHFAEINGNPTKPNEIHDNRQNFTKSDESDKIR